CSISHGSKPPKINSISSKHVVSWTKTTTDSIKSKTDSSSSSQSENCAKIWKAPSSASSDRQASVKPPSADPSHVPSIENSSASASAACAMKPKSAATDVPTSARCPDVSSKDCVKRKPQ